MPQFSVTPSQGSGPRTFTQDGRGRSRLAELLLSRGLDSSPTQHPAQAAARAGQALTGAFLQKQATDKAEARQQASSDTLAEALQTGQTAKPFTNPDTGEVESSTQPSAVMARILSGNQDTAPLAIQLQMQQIANQQKQQSQLSAEQRKIAQAKDLFKFQQENKQSPSKLLSAEELAQQIELRTAGKSETNINVGGASPPGKLADDKKALLGQGFPADSPEVRAIDQELKTLALSPAERKIDELAAADFNEFIVAGGIADVEKGLEQLNEVITALESGRDDLTGNFVGNLPEFAKSALLPDAQAAQDAVEEVVQRNLRLVLGAQFTEKEGVKLIARAFNPRLSEKENAKRVRRLGQAILSVAKAKMAAAKFLEQNGTLKGFKGTTQFTLAGIEREFDKAEGLSPAEEQELQQLRKELGR